MNIKKCIVLLIAFICSATYAQQIHVEYLMVRSPIATVKEDLYIKDNRVISIQDSIINFNSQGAFSAVRKGKLPPAKINFISLLGKQENKIFFRNGKLENEFFFIKDDVEKPLWTIDKTSSKKILGYNCIKANGEFRGTKFIAYFTEELPYSAGPFLFYGLPGLILDIREENKGYNIWKAEKITFEVPAKINFEPKFPAMKMITMKNFVALYDQENNFQDNEILKDLPPETKVVSTKVRFGGLETIFEWEKDTTKK